jgi:hypothetical protein
MTAPNVISKPTFSYGTIHTKKGVNLPHPVLQKKVLYKASSKSSPHICIYSFLSASYISSIIWYLQQFFSDVCINFITIACNPG